jgi:hypothetical protein
VVTNDPTTAHFTAIKTWETPQTMDKVQKYNSFKGNKTENVYCSATLCSMKFINMQDMKCTVSEVSSVLNGNLTETELFRSLVFPL